MILYTCRFSCYKSGCHWLEVVTWSYVKLKLCIPRGIHAIALFTVESRGVFFIAITIKFNVDARQFRVILSFSPKRPRTHVDFLF